MIVFPTIQTVLDLGLQPPWQSRPGLGTTAPDGTTFEEHATTRRYWALAWSPAGDRFLVQRGLGSVDPWPSSIFLASLDGTELSQVTPQWTEAPDWSSRGQVAFGRYSDLYCRPDCENIWVTRLGGRPRRLTHRGGNSPSWRRAGRNWRSSALAAGGASSGGTSTSSGGTAAAYVGSPDAAATVPPGPGWQMDRLHPRWRHLLGSQHRRRPPPPGERATPKPRGPDRDVTGLAASATTLARPKPTRTRVPGPLTATECSHALLATTESESACHGHEDDRLGRTTKRRLAVLVLDDWSSGLPGVKPLGGLRRPARGWLAERVRTTVSRPTLGGHGRADRIACSG